MTNSAATPLWQNPSSIIPTPTVNLLKNEELELLCQVYNQVLQVIDNGTFNQKYDAIGLLVHTLKQIKTSPTLSEIQDRFPAIRFSEVTEKILTVLTEKEVFIAQEYLSGQIPYPENIPPSPSFVLDELNALKAHNLISPNSKLAFIGSGSMPSTAIELINEGYASIDLIDRDPIAVELGKAVLHKFYDRKPHQIMLHEASADDMNYTDYDVIWIANFIDDKPSCFKKIKQDRKGKKTTILIRDSEGVRALVNMPVLAEDMPVYGEPLYKTAISSHRINNTYIFCI